MRFFTLILTVCAIGLGSIAIPAHADTLDTRAEQTSPHGFLPLDLPNTLTPEQKQRAIALVTAAEPRLIELHTQLTQTLSRLRNLSFTADTPPDALEELGRKLVSLRNDILVELQKVSQQLETQAGFNPGWGQRRTCALQQMAPCTRTGSTASGAAPSIHPPARSLD